MIEKEFRIKPWWKAPYVRNDLLTLMASVVVTGGLLFVFGLPFPVMLSILFVFLIFNMLLISMNCFGVLLTNNLLIIQNGILPFWRKKVEYTSLEKVKCLGEGVKDWPRIVVYKKGYRGPHWSYVVNQVAKRDYFALVEALRERGVTVEAKGLFAKELSNN